MNKLVFATFVFLVASSNDVPKFAVGTVEPNERMLYEIGFPPGSHTVEVQGDEKSDLDCYLTDAQNNVLAKDERDIDSCELIVTVQFHQTLTIAIANRGKTSNRYVITAN